MIRNNTYVILLAVYFVCTTNTACGTKTQLSDTSSEIETIVEVLDLSGFAMESVSSFEFKLVHKNIPGTRIGDLIFSEASGIISSDNSMLVEGKFVFGNLTLSSGFSTVDGNSFFLNPLTQNWENSEISANPLGFFDPEKGIQNIMSNINSPKFASNTQKYWNIEGFIPASSFSPFVGTTVNNNVKVLVWIDKNSLYLTKAIISGKLNEYDYVEDKNSIQRIISLSRFNEKIVIENPLR